MNLRINNNWFNRLRIWFKVKNILSNKMEGLIQLLAFLNINCKFKISFYSIKKNINKNGQKILFISEFYIKKISL